MQNEELFHKIIISDYALSNVAGEKLYLGGDGPGAYAREQPYSIPITTTTIDELVRERGIYEVDFIKMDIEGSELKALYVSVETIRKFRP